MYTMKDQQVKEEQPLYKRESQHELETTEKLPILENIDLLLKSTKNIPSLLKEAEGCSIISKLERDTIMKHFGESKQRLAALYLLLSSRSCPATKVFRLLNTTGNENVASVFEGETSGTNNEGSHETEKMKWQSLQKLIVENIDRVSSHTRNLALVFSFALGVGLITEKDREKIANYSQLEIEQLRKFYTIVSRKEEDAYEKLLKVLRMTSNNWALDVLQITLDSD